MIDPRLGVIRRVERQSMPPEVPAAFVSYAARVSDTSRFGPWQADQYAYGGAFFDQERARSAAIGEAVERYCGNMIPSGLKSASYRELVAAGEPAVHPSEFILYSDTQYAQRGFPFVPFTDELPVRWTAARDLLTGGRVLVPASLVWINYFRDRYAGEPRTNFVIYSGIATGQTREDAERAALEELIERDAMTIWWQSGAPVVGIDLPSASTVLAAIAPKSNLSNIRYHLVHIPTVVNVPVIGVLLQDTKQHIVTFGTACRADASDAAHKALVEAVQLYTLSRECLDPHSPTWRAFEAGILHSFSFLPYRADRAYLDDVRPDFRNVIDLQFHTQLYLDVRMHVYVQRILKPCDYVSLSQLPRLPTYSSRSAYLERLAERGFRVLAVDLTTEDVRSAGLEVVRVIVPGLYPNAPAAFPFLGGTRLYNEPVAQGWRPSPCAEDDLILAPMPYT
ncbi:MAG: YcaO-like family protein [Egibacteraceae bacterium]